MRGLDDFETLEGNVRRVAEAKSNEEENHLMSGERAVVAAGKGAQRARCDSRIRWR